MKDLAHDVAAGRLVELGDIPPITEIVHNWPFQNDDWIHRKILCASCRQRFEISVETYHGQGGSWRPVF
jgi:hypothetical protein